MDKIKKLNFLILLLPLSIFSQELIRCKDSLNYIVKEIDSKYVSLKINGKIRQLENPQVFLVNENTIIQLIVNSSKTIQRMEMKK